MLILITIAIFTIFLTGVLNILEVAIFSVPLSKVGESVELKRHGSRSLLFLKEKIYQPITLFVIFINIVGLGGSILVGSYGAKVMGNAWLGVFSGLLIFFVILFGDILPKNLGVRYALSLALASAPFLKLLIKIFSPLILVLSKITFLKKIAGQLPFSASEEEIKFLTMAGAKTGEIEEHEARIIQSAFKLNDITAKDIMTARPLISWLDGNRTVGEKREKIKKLFHSRILVCDSELDKVIGVCRKSDLLQALMDGRENVLIKEFAQWVFSVPDSRVADDLLRDFQKNKSHFAVVIDEYGGVAGIATREDILQELVGELISEKDIAPNLFKRISKNEILSHGQTKIAYLNQFISTNLKGALTLNGFLLKKFEKFPRVGDAIESDGLKFIVEETTEKSIERVRIVKSI